MTAELAVAGSLAESLTGTNRAVLEREVLPAYLPQRRWFASKGEALASTRLAYAVALPGSDVVFAEVEATLPGRTEAYVLPLGAAWTDGGAAPTLALAPIRDGTHVGHLTDAFSLDGLTEAMLAGFRAAAALPTDAGTLVFRPTAELAGLHLPHGAAIRRLSAEQSNSSWIVGDTVVMKLVRRVLAGIHPEAEMTRVLTERGYANTPPLYGDLVRITADGTPHTVALAQGFVPNQGDGWGWTLDHLGRGGAAADGYDTFARNLGTRLGELHTVLSQPCDDPAFAPEPADLGRWADGAIEQIDLALDLLAGVQGWPDAATRDQAGLLTANRDRLHEAARRLAGAGSGALQTRVHGDFHLGQVLVSDQDAYIIDFEGEPARTMAQRRAKSCPLRDMAGLLRSFDYAAASAAPQGEPHALSAFRDRASRVALDAYRNVLTSCPTPWVPPQAEGALLDLFLLEKAAYEIRYEVANRPSWIAIPLGGFHAIAERLLGAQA